NNAKEQFFSLLRRMSTSTWTTTTSATGMPTLEPHPMTRRRATFFEEVRLDISSGRYSPTQLPREEARGFTTPMVKAKSKFRVPLRSKNEDNLPPKAPSASYSSESSGNQDKYDLMLSNKRDKNATLTKERCNENIYEKSFTKGNSNIQTSSNGGIFREFDRSKMQKATECENSLQNQQKSINTPNHYSSSVYNERFEDQSTKKFPSRIGASSFDKKLISSSVPEERKGQAFQSQSKGTFSEIEEESSTDEHSKGNCKDAHLKRGSPEREKINKSSSDKVVNGKREKIYKIKDGTKYDLDSLSDHQLLNMISMWDYPIFELADSSGTCMLSHLCYRVFSEVGLFETFKIPVPEILETIFTAWKWAIEKHL
ncbi:cGMP-inhibited 3',5'-cyclic phosphodiesterase A, partial [Armadillidium vulgare]